MKAPKKLTKTFTVGEDKASADFTPVEIDALVYKIAIWFGTPECPRSYPDNVQAAKDKVRECILGLNAQGDPWEGAPDDFAKRIKIKCAWDMAADKGIYTRGQHAMRKTKKAKELAEKEARQKERLERRKQKERELAAKEAEKAAAAERSRSEELLTPMTEDFDMEAYRDSVEKDILGSFPELDNPAHRPNVRSLSGLYAQREVLDREIVRTDNVVKREGLLRSLKLLEDMADSTMRRLGVHPDQIRKKVSAKGATSIADLVTTLHDDRDFQSREKTWALQFALQLWWMSEHHKGDKSGPQLSDFEIWHLTRTRPIRFTCRCGKETLIVEGFTPAELRDFLIAEGVLVEEPVIPNMIAAESLVGLATEEL